MKINRPLLSGFLCLSSIATTYAACPAAGSGITVNGTTTTESGCTISTSAGATPGANANLGGTINLSSGSITTTGATSYGAYTNGTNSIINLSNTSILTSLADGLYLDSGQIFFNTGSVTTSFAYGAEVVGTNSSLNLENVDFTVNGASGAGISVQLGGNTLQATNCIITTTANGAKGVDVGIGSGDASSAFLNDCEINTPQGSGPPSFGAVVARNGSSITIQDSVISSEVYGLHTISSDSSIISDNTVTNINATSSVFGAYAQNSSTITLQNGSSISTSGGTNTHGFVIQDGSFGNVNNSSIQTSGTNAQGLYLIGFSFNAEANLSDATVSTSGTNANAALLFANSGVTNILNATNTTFSAKNADVITASGGIGIITFDNVVAKASSDHNLLLVNGTDPVTLTITAQSSSFSGDILVADGDSCDATFNDSTWTGTALDITNLTLNNGNWIFNDDSTISNNLINNGLITSASQGDSFKTLTVESSYIGENGLISLNAFLEDREYSADSLVIDGGMASGTTFLSIQNAGGLGAQTSGNGILVVSAINGSLTTENSFILEDPVLAGPYEYDLYQGSLDGEFPDSWYLRSNTSLNGLAVPNYRPETSLYTSLPALTLLYGQILVDTFHERMGEERPFGKSSRETNKKHLLWARFIFEHGNQNGNDFGILKNEPSFSYNAYAGQLGIDLYKNENPNQSSDAFGAYGAFGQISNHVEHFNNLQAGKGIIDVYSIGTYWTHFGANSWYLDVILQGSYYNTRATSRYISSFNTHGFGLTSSIEGGYPFKLGADFILEPELQFVYQFAHLNNSSDSAANIRFSSVDSLLGRLGARLVKSFDRRNHISTLWVRASVLDEFFGDPNAEFSSSTGYIPFSCDLSGVFAKFDAGLDVKISSYFALYGSGGYQTNFGQDSAYDIKVGLKINW